MTRSNFVSYPFLIYTGLQAFASMIQPQLVKAARHGAPTRALTDTVVLMAAHLESWFDSSYHGNKVTQVCAPARPGAPQLQTCGVGGARATTLP